MYNSLRYGAETLCSDWVQKALGFQSVASTSGLLVRADYDVDYCGQHRIPIPLHVDVTTWTCLQTRSSPPTVA